jgi:fibronectin type 3 domain-containing protein
MIGRIVVAASLAAATAITSLPVAQAQVCSANIPHLTGTWDVLSYQMPINPISLSLLPDGKVLVVSGSENDAYNDKAGAQSFRNAVWDPQVAGPASVSVQNVTYDMFCSGVVTLADGRALVVGGTGNYTFTGEARASLFDAKSARFAQSQSMAQGRWYGSVIELADGRAMAMSGLTQTGAVTRAIEIYDPSNPGGGWVGAGTAPFSPPLYPRIFLLPNGNVFYNGQGSGASNANGWMFNPATTAWTVSAATTRDRDYGAAVMLPLLPPAYTPRLMNLGGGLTATATTELIDLSAATPAWVAGPNMSAARVELNAVLLPNGKVLASGGSASNEVPDQAGRTADLYDPSSNTMSSAGTAAFSRLYHSTALLLPDGRVASLGSNPGARGSYESVIEIWTPPYLFDANDRPVTTRPAITAMSPSSGVVGYGSLVTVSYSSASAIASAVLMRLGSTTHAFNMDQRLIGLCGATLPCSASNNALTLTMPPNGKVAPPGYYMLFLLDSAGVPSKAQIVQLTPFTTLAPAGTISSPAADLTIAAGSKVTFGTTSTAAKYSWVFPGGTPAASTLQNPGSVTFSSPGTFVASLTLTDASGNPDPHPPLRTITVTPSAGDFSIQITPAVVTVAPGGSASFSVTVTSLSGFAGPVSLAVSSELGFPTGVTSVGFSPSTINGAGTATLTMSTTTSTVPYAVSLSVTGTSGTLTHTASTTLVIAMPPPSSVSAVAGNSTVSLSWPAATGASSYQLRRSTISGGPYRTLACPASTSFTDTAVVNGTSYFYVVAGAFTGGPDAGGTSAASPQSSATPLPPPPATPTGFVAKAASGQVALSWTAVTGATSYRVKRATVSGGPYGAIASPAGAAYTDTSVGNGTTYYYVVSAVNLGGESGNSSQVSATPSGGTVSSESLFTTQTPASPSATDGVAYEMGMKFRVARAGSITALRYWKALNDTGTHVGRLWSSTGTLLGSVTFTGENASGWQQQALPAAIGVQANTTYVVSVNIGSRYPYTASGLASSIVNGDISSVADGNNGVFGTSGAFPTKSFNNANYFRDLVFVPGVAGTAAKLTLSPASTLTANGLRVTYTAKVQDANGNTVTSATNAINFSVSGVSGTFSPASPVTAVNGVATTAFTPTSAGTATITVSAAGLTGASATLTVAATSESLFTTQTPARPSVADGHSYELGMKFRSARAGVINGVRYWKATGETGTHVGRIWSASGQLLASVTFSGESASGWQRQLFSVPFAIQANTTYVVSVNIVTSYPFTGSGLATAIVNGDLASVADAANGVYGTPSLFPTSSFQNANYFRDVIFTPGP